MSQSGLNDLRRKAEKQLAEREGRIKTLERADLESLTHELAVHQVELEIQNEELRRTRLEAEATRDRYLDLYDFAPVGYFTLDENNRIVEANLTGCQLLKTERNNILKKSFTKFIQPDESEKFYLQRRKVLESGSKQTGELQMQTADKAPFYAQVISLKVQEESLRLTVIDITERKKVEETLKTREEKYRAIVETSQEGILIGTPEGKIVFANQRMADLLGYSLDEITGKIGLEFIDKDQKELVLQTREELQKGDKIQREFKFRRKDGSVLWTLASVAPQFDDDGQHVTNLVMHTDITERKQAEEALARAKDELEIKVKERTEQLQESYDEIMQSQKALKEAHKQLKDYSNKITQVQEEERKRIAYELHDDTAQYLSILKMQLGALAESTEIQNPKVKEKLQFLEKDADRAFNDVRRYSHELRPTTLEHQGLAAALEQIAEDFNKLGQFSVEVHIEGMEPELSEEVKLGFFRVAQEALNNCRKHAKASHAKIDVHFNHKRMRMIVSNDGEGFNVKEVLKKSSGKGTLGLLSMRERANLIGAKLKIESELDKGTTIKVEIHL